MDDFDHSVLIAEQDWDYFYTESEECSVQQAKLASLDESGLSDVDDDEISMHTSSALPQISAHVEEKQHASIHTSQNSELTECSSLKNDSAGQTCDARLKDRGTTSECFCLDNSNEEISATEPSDLVTNNLRGNGENQGENKATSSLCNQNETGSENAVTKVTDSSPVLRKEKERWFVTVNDSPVRLREKVGTSGQKKRRKKKLSKNGNQQSGGRDSLSALNNNAEKIKEFSDRRKFERPPKSGSDDLLSNTCLNNGHKENDLSNSCNIQEEIEHTPDNSVQFINNRGEGSPKFILGASTPTDPLNSESTGQQELFEQSKNEKESPSSQDTLCLQSSNTRSKTPDLGPTRPIFAISSFWDEMEKLTINDILDLRLANMSPLKESIIPDQSNFLDTVDAHEVDFKDDSIEDIGLVEDAADSDYFTHLDDCKPDRSSCEFSTFSDYDEEFQQLHGFSTNPSPEPCEIKTQRFLEPTCAKSFLQDDQIWPSNEIVRLYPEGHLFSEAQSQIRDTFLTTNQGVSCFLLDHCDIRRSTPSPVLSMSDVVDDHCLLSMIEILNDTDSEQFRTRTSNRHVSVPFPFSQNPSVPEMYEDFFTDFEVGNFFFPSVQGTTKFEKNMVPIYSSSSRSLVKEMIQSDSEDESTPIRVVAHCNSSGSPNMCFITDRRNPWRNLSLRRIKFSFMERIWFRMATSWVSPKIPIDDKVFQENWNIGTTSNSSISLLENQALGNLTEKQIYASSTFSGPGIDRFRFSIKQADMCLVCIAFASWVLKSINPQSTDMWKAALLANVSAISAIQYLRYVNEEDEP
ncbi:uncharacterized protein perm1b [Misgurnus anguillicaudatus]|uniref:uncharacterized protein perm1b n=1 Tax=Misgurnus anguillicaudatus TaxID=75329 RepID=UPI003CCF98A3